MRWNCMSKALRFLQITAEHQDCPFFTVFLTTKSLSQNISITLLQISLKLHEHRGRYWRKKLPWTVLKEQFPVPRNTAASKISNSVISSLWQLRCHCNPDHKKFSSLSNTTVVAIFLNLCLWRRGLCSNLRGIDHEKLYRATLRWPTVMWKMGVAVTFSLLMAFLYLGPRPTSTVCGFSYTIFDQTSRLNTCSNLEADPVPLRFAVTFAKGFVAVASLDADVVNFYGRILHRTLQPLECGNNTGDVTYKWKQHWRHDVQDDCQWLLLIWKRKYFCDCFFGPFWSLLLHKGK